ncbi:hypothetical protein AB0I81_12185 [Nonomuraea sp. NPDC050404]|uniref:hypothetical protein n=1 Tax=Nonomuraea sp. NPDC050404 TaxID=3155783 RepID=UPI0033E97036
MILPPVGQEPARLRRGPPPWRRLPVLISLTVALLALALTWWLVLANPSRPAATTTTGAGRGSIPAAPDSAPETAGSTTGDAPEATGSTTGGGTASPTPGDPDSGAAAGPSTRAARQQAEKIEELLSSSSSARSSLSDAIGRATRCEPDGVRAIGDITTSRRDQLATARTLAVSALRGGVRLKDALVDALDASHEADAAFLTWARRHARADCSGPVTNDRDYQRGLERSEAAQEAKNRFARAWLPIAQTYELTIWKPEQI